MTQVFVVSDLHLGHKKILGFSPNRYGKSIEEHDQWIKERWLQVVNKRCLVYVLGDVAFDKDALLGMKTWPGRKVLVRGNHDGFKEEVYHEVFEKILGVVKYKKHWLSHAPVHPAELRGLKNIHGHVHNKIIKRFFMKDNRYIPVCVEQTGGAPIRFDKLTGAVSYERRN